MISMIEVMFAYASKGDKDFKLRECFVHEFDLELPHKVYDIGIDQSTSCTGISFKPLDDSFVLVMEIRNLDRDPGYIPRVCKILNDLIKGDVQVRYAVTEEPLGILTGKRSQLLVNLHKDIMNTLNSNPNIQKPDTIAVASWRNGLMPHVRDGDRRKKPTIVKAVFERYPELDGLDNYSNSDYDGLESLGIIIGYSEKHGITAEDSVLKNVGKKNTLKKGVSFFKYQLVDNFLEDNKELLSLLPKLIGSELVPKEYNEDETLYNNVKMALVDDLSLFYVSNSVTALALLTQMKLFPKEGHAVLCITVPKSKADEKFIRFMFSKGFYPVLYE